MSHKIKLIVLSLIVIVTTSLFCYFNPLNLSVFSKPIEKVRLGIAKESLAALAMIADKQGYFSEQDLDVTVTHYKGGKQALVNGLIAGKVDMATAADVPIVINSFKLQNFKIVATIGSSDNEPRIVARRDRNILQPGDLYEKKVMTKKGSAVHFFLNVFLAHSGLSEDKINLSFTKDGNEMVNLLAKGEIDAFSHREPYISQAIKALGDNAVTFEKPGAYTKTYNLVVSNEFIKKKHTTIQKVLAALLMAESFSKNNPEKTIKLVSKFIGSSEEALTSIWKDIDLKLSLEQALVSTLTAEAWWAISDNLVNETNVPNYYSILEIKPLMEIKPEAINLQ